MYTRFFAKNVVELISNHVPPPISIPKKRHNVSLKASHSNKKTCILYDIECILVVVSENATEACLETVDCLLHEYPSLVKKLVQQRKYIGGAMQDAVDYITSSHLLFFASDLSNNLDIILHAHPKLARYHLRKICL